MKKKSGYFHGSMRGQPTSGTECQRLKAKEIYSHVTKDQENTKPSSGNAGWHVLKGDSMGGRNY